MLKALDRRPDRPAHIHFIVSAPGYKPGTTHRFTSDCPWPKDHAVFGIKKSLIADVKKVGGQWQVEWDFRIEQSVSA